MKTIKTQVVNKVFAGNTLLLLISAVMLWGCTTGGPSRSLEGIRIIDTHIHLYDATRAAGVDWPPPSDKVLFRPVLPEHYDAICRVNGIESTVIVEASSRVEDNQWVLDLVKHNPERYAALVGNLPIGSDAFGGLLERFAKDPRFVGIRMRDRPGGDAFFTDAVWRDLALLSKKGLVLDVLLADFTLEDVITVAERLPELKIMINHLTGLTITGQAAEDDWSDTVRRAAAHANLHCKVSGIFQRSGQMPAPKALSYYAPIFEVVYEAFGEDRIIYGSNWPVTDRGGRYAEQLAIIHEFFAPEGERVLRKLFAFNAQKFYGLK
jgi:L-fuconolactonase